MTPFKFDIFTKIQSNWDLKSNKWTFFWKPQILELYLDDEKVTLPDGIEAVVVLNIPCWGAGVRPWELGSGNESFEPPSICDGFLEIFCIYSSFHIAQMQVFLELGNY